MFLGRHSKNVCANEIRRDALRRLPILILITTLGCVLRLACASICRSVKKGMITEMDGHSKKKSFEATKQNKAIMALNFLRILAPVMLLGMLPKAKPVILEVRWGVEIPNTCAELFSSNRSTQACQKATLGPVIWL